MTRSGGLFPLRFFLKVEGYPKRQNESRHAKQRKAGNAVGLSAMLVEQTVRRFHTAFPRLSSRRFSFQKKESTVP
jgi:hypothetical protein